MRTARSELYRTYGACAYFSAIAYQRLRAGLSSAAPTTLGQKPTRLRAAVEVEGPGERFAVRGQDEAGGFQDGGHALRGVNKSAKAVAREAKPEVLQDKGGADEPLIARIGEREQAPRAHGRKAKQRVCVGVTADDTVERDDISVGQRGSRHGEVAKDEVNGA